MISEKNIVVVAYLRVDGVEPPSHFAAPSTLISIIGVSSRIASIQRETREFNSSQMGTVYTQGKLDISIADYCKARLNLKLNLGVVNSSLTWAYG